MPLTRTATDAFGAVTICLVALLVLVDVFCISYVLFFRYRVLRERSLPLAFFNGPWVVRIMLVASGIWWGFGEIERLDLFRGERRVLDSLSSKWQKNLCRIYILSNFGFAEPCLFLCLVLLLRGSLKKSDLGTLRRQWNAKTTAQVFLFCLPIFILQLVIVFAGPLFSEREGSEDRLTKLSIYLMEGYSSGNDDKGPIFCMYPLLSTVVHGLFASFLVGYLFHLGTKMISVVINGTLEKRICYLLFSVVSFLPVRVLFLCLTVLSRPGDLSYEEVLEFLSFLAMLAFIAVATVILVYLPVADSLALGDWNSEIGMKSVRAATRTESLFCQ